MSLEGADHFDEMALLFKKLKGIKCEIISGSGGLEGRSQLYRGIEIEFSSAGERDAFTKKLENLGLFTTNITQGGQPSLSVSLSEETIDRYAKAHANYQKELGEKLIQELETAQTEAAQEEAMEEQAQLVQAQMRAVAKTQAQPVPTHLQAQSTATATSAPIQAAQQHPAPVHPAPVHPAPVHPAPVHPAPQQKPTITEITEELESLVEVIPRAGIELAAPVILPQHKYEQNKEREKQIEVSRTNQSYADFKSYLEGLKKGGEICKKENPTHGILNFNEDPGKKQIELDIQGTKNVPVKALAQEAPNKQELVFSMEKGKITDDTALKNLCDLVVAASINKPNAVLEVPENSPCKQATIKALNDAIIKYKDKFPLDKDGKPTHPIIKGLTPVPASPKPSS